MGLKKKIAIGVSAVLAAGVIATAITIPVVIASQPAQAQLEQTEKKKALINLNGKNEEVDVPTYNSITTNKPQTDNIEHGMGNMVNTTSPEGFKNDTLGNFFDFDGYFGAQCWDLVATFSYNYARGRVLSTCGTGAAKGMMNCAEQNAGDDYVVIWNANEIQPGDILVFGFGEYGHTGMAMGYPNNGYITLLGQNQGGVPYPSGGSSTNIINISLSGFIGAYRPKSYIKPAPQPTPAPTPDPLAGCPVGTKLTLKTGNTLGQIMLNCTGKVEWGKAMDAYATTWKSTLVKPGQIVLDGWRSPAGVGLWAGDVIERIK